jgi:DnaK suppressor protein
MMTSARTSRFTEEFRDRLAWARLNLARTVAATDADLEALAAHESRALAEDAATGTVGALLARLEGQAQRQLAEIDAAQARLEADEFGVCEACGRAIALARLRATPTARRCAACEATANSARGDHLPSTRRYPGGAPRVRPARALTLVIGILGAALVTASAGAQDGADARARGEAAFKSNGCYGCHMVGKFGTPIGPDLSHVGTKYSADYLARWLRDPALQRPSAHMPALELTEADLRALAQYLGSLR